MKIIRLYEVDSTQKYLKEYVSKNDKELPLCVTAKIQTSGVGSRGNSWVGTDGNLFFSFALKKENLPQDLPLQSASIYFTFILKEILEKKGSKLFLKWPNDFYIEDKKIGGAITSISKDILFCGIGLNLFEVDSSFGKLDIKLDINEVLELYFKEIEKKTSWKQIFSLFKIEFIHSKKFQATIDNVKVSLEKAILNSDGSIQIENKKVFSLR
ncbi:biotin--[acetyl-CoA-carboxylase] ligase [Aliarcobacter trophiarum LMG 25534]|uniref:Biotin--[acetyl-CoA-carboxylase] ligase n=1 Tax=Aliarcobacter trophiarum LMG 25534 TaxID=1032241 RepID=A0AAD0QI35_9BACT|nr:biotin--[acetyl-CoA-carboxylase] ligase [Aliarcobacter trophiarum]AXK48283.1 biotin-[acetyl-CoA-carboxylase] ligase [Aliarcobacter trophiarum LMG 25534]RXI28559.1 biotin--[acetyl-CoA-carboxylase] ligase [Aliarcobacter trophiarum]RXJ93041.1 biotin--[acetyl-CoA-carboxylase] ligase [Aliarcobacter trophiarum LMG 25534]